MHLKQDKIFYNYYGNATPQIRGDLFVTDIQVWKSINQITTDKSKERDANVYIDLSSIGLGGSYPSNLRDTLSTTEPGKTEQEDLLY